MTHPQPSPIVDEVADTRALLMSIGHAVLDLASNSEDRLQFNSGICAAANLIKERAAALVSPPKAGEGEPVAWRWKAHGHEAGPWIVVHDKGTAEAAMSLFASKGKHQSVQPLYATQQPRVDGVREAVIEECARVCEAEADLRFEQSRKAAFGDKSWGADTPASSIAQAHKAITARGLATAIRALANPGDGE